MTMNFYFIGRSSITSNTPPTLFTGTDPEYLVEDYLNAVTTNLISNIGPQLIHTPLTKIGFVDKKHWYKLHLKVQLKIFFSFT